MTNSHNTDIIKLMIFSSSIVIGIICIMFFSPLAAQFTDEDARGGVINIKVEELMDNEKYPEALNYVDSLIDDKSRELPRFAYFDRFLSEKERYNAMNARADVYDLQWTKITLLQKTNDREALITILKDYSKIIGYNQDQAIALLNELKEK